MVSIKRATHFLAKVAVPALGALIMTAPAQAVDFTTVGNTTGPITFNGFVDQGGTIINGLSGQLTLTLTAFDPTHWTFSYNLLNTSSSPITASAITGFGFDVSSALDLGTTSLAPGGFFDTIASGTISQGPGFDVDVCFKNGQDNNCAGSPGNQGVNMGAPAATGSFTLELVNGTSTLSLTDFVLRYQAIAGPNGTPESAIGTPTNLPEPSTWAMMLLGLGATGIAIRRARRKTVQIAQAA
jgi:hypothetical protein